MTLLEVEDVTLVSSIVGSNIVVTTSFSSANCFIVSSDFLSGGSSDVVSLCATPLFGPGRVRFGHCKLLKI